jgi:nucleotide-binding universal stress UspA family protein
MYDRILLSTDGSIASEQAEAHALELAAAHDAELLVLGTKRRPDEYRALLGSVTDRVLRLTTRPATVVKTETSE